jgi:hypothetical protein
VRWEDTNATQYSVPKLCIVPTIWKNSPFVTVWPCTKSVFSSQFYSDNERTITVRCVKFGLVIEHTYAYKFYIKYCFAIKY